MVAKGRTKTTTGNQFTPMRLMRASKEGYMERTWLSAMRGFGSGDEAVEGESGDYGDECQVIHWVDRRSAAIGLNG